MHNKDFPSTLGQYNAYFLHKHYAYVSMFTVGWGKLRDKDFFEYVAQYKFSLAFENCECETLIGVKS